MTALATLTFFLLLTFLTCSKIYMIVGTKIFPVTLYTENLTTEEVLKKLPKSFIMKGPVAREKFYQFPEQTTFTANPEYPGQINVGDIMLDDKVLVLFYQSFQSKKSYTRIGFVDDVTDLEEALGVGDITIRWSTCDPRKDTCSERVLVQNEKNYVHIITWKIFTFACLIFL